MLRANVDEHTTITISPIDDETYAECLEEDTLGGNAGYFIIRSSQRETEARFEVLAKASSFEAAGILFNMIVASRGVESISR